MKNSHRWFNPIAGVVIAGCLSSCQTLRVATHPSPQARIQALQKEGAPPAEQVEARRSEKRGSRDTIERAKGLIQQGDHQKASALLRKEISRVPTRREPHLVLAGALLQSGDYKGAEETLSSAAQRWPRDAEIHLLTSYCLLEQEKREDALIQFQETLQYSNHPKVKIAAYLGLASLYEEMEDQEMADRHYALALAIAPQVKEILVNIQKELLWQEPIVADGEGFGGQRIDRYRKSRIESELGKLPR